MTRKGMETGVKLPSSYDGGNPAVNFWLAILNKAKVDNAPMWQDFQGTELYKEGSSGIPDSLEVAWWVSRYVREDK